VFVTLLSPRPVDEVRAALAGSGDRFTFRRGARVVEVAGRLRADGEGTRLVADARTRVVVTLPLGLAVALVLLVSFSEPVAFVLAVVLAVTAAVAAPRLLVAYRGTRRRLLDALAAELDATVLPDRARGRSR